MGCWLANEVATWSLSRAILSRRDVYWETTVGGDADRTLTVFTRNGNLVIREGASDTLKIS